MKRIIKTDNAPAPIGPYNQAVKVATGNGEMLYTSGQIAMDAVTKELKLDNLDEETTLVMDNLQAILVSAGMDWCHVLKCSIFLSDMDSFQQVNKIYGSYFNEETAPARETVEVAKLPKDVNVEISLIAYKPL